MGVGGGSVLALPRDAHTLAPLGPLRAYIAGEGPQRGLPGRTAKDKAPSGRLVVSAISFPGGARVVIAPKGHFYCPSLLRSKEPLAKPIVF